MILITKKNQLDDIGLPRRRLLGQELLLLRFRHLHRLLLQVLEREVGALQFLMWTLKHIGRKIMEITSFFAFRCFFVVFFSRFQWIIPPNGHVLRGKIPSAKHLCECHEKFHDKIQALENRKSNENHGFSRTSCQWATKHLLLYLQYSWEVPISGAVRISEHRVPQKWGCRDNMDRCG